MACEAAEIVAYLSVMKLTEDTFLRVEKGELKWLLVKRMPGQGWIQSSGQCFSSLVDFSFCNHRNKPKATLLCWIEGVTLCLCVCVCVCKIMLNAVYLALSKMLTIYIFLPNEENRYVHVCFF